MNLGSEALGRQSLLTLGGGGLDVRGKQVGNKTEQAGVWHTLARRAASWALSFLLAEAKIRQTCADQTPTLFELLGGSV